MSLQAHLTFLLHLVFLPRRLKHLLPFVSLSSPVSDIGDNDLPSYFPDSKRMCSTFVCLLSSSKGSVSKWKLCLDEKILYQTTAKYSRITAMYYEELSDEKLDFPLTRNKRNTISTNNTIVIIHACLLPLKTYLCLIGEVIKMLFCLQWDFLKIFYFLLIFYNQESSLII